VHKNHEATTLKEQLSVVVKAQLDFQNRVENQLSMMQTMMQTVCQLVNNEIMTNKKQTHPSQGSSAVPRQSLISKHPIAQERTAHGTNPRDSAHRFTIDSI
jgi:hypothetical protein